MDQGSARWYKARIPCQAHYPVACLPGGGADNTTLDPVQPLRPASIKGMLRFWWRALHGDWPLSKLRETEAHIFGDTEQGQGLRVIVQAQNCKKLARGFDAGRGGSPLGYLGYGPIQYDSKAKGNRSNRDAIDKDSIFEVTLMHRNPDALTEAVQALWLFGALGGIGLRARRGWGECEYRLGR